MLEQGPRLGLLHTCQKKRFNYDQLTMQFVSRSSFTNVGPLSFHFVRLYSDWWAMIDIFEKNPLKRYILAVSFKLHELFWISQTNNHTSCFEWCSVKILDDGQNCACLSELLAHLIQLSVYCSATASPLDCSNNLFYLMGFVTGLISWCRGLTFPKIFSQTKRMKISCPQRSKKGKKSTLVSQTRTHFK